MRINKQALSRPEFRKLRDNLQVIHGTQPTVVGSLLSTLAGMGLVASLVLHWLAKAYDKRFAELPHS